jgi:hypothetical protein
MMMRYRVDATLVVDALSDLSAWALVHKALASLPPEYGVTLEYVSEPACPDSIPHDEYATNE